MNTQHKNSQESLAKPAYSMPFVDLRAQYYAYKSEIDTAIARVLDSQAFILGAESEALEEELARFVGARYVLTCSSGTSALLLALLALGVQRGDEVITSVFSFVAAAEMIAFVGATPVFVDIMPDSYMLNLDQVRAKITPRTKAIIPVCLFGAPYAVSELAAIAKSANVAIIEDGAQSFGAWVVQNTPNEFIQQNPLAESIESDIPKISGVGSDLYGANTCALDSASGIYASECAESNKLSYDKNFLPQHRLYSPCFGDIGITSFFPSKPLACYGDGGAVFCKDKALYERLQKLRNHGQSSKYEHKILGLNARLDNLQCAILRIKLKYFADECIVRNKVAQNYRTHHIQYNATNPLWRYLIPQKIEYNSASVYAQYVLRLDSHTLILESSIKQAGISRPNTLRTKLLTRLAHHSIPTAIHYPKPLHLQEAFAFLGHKKGEFPVAERVCEEIFSLPFSPFLSLEAQCTVTKSLDSALSELTRQ